MPEFSRFQWVRCIRFAENTRHAAAQPYIAIPTPSSVYVTAGPTRMSVRVAFPLYTTPEVMATAT
jgi:hypothetical protein